MSLAKSTIATVGSGVMAEAMIAGLLRGKQVAPNQIIASHPRADRRSELISSYGISTVEDNVVGRRARPTSSSSPSSRRCSCKVGRELAPALQRGQLVISIIAGATTTALANALRHARSCAACPTRRPSWVAA